jgi:hypothetical protein
MAAWLRRAPPMTRPSLEQVVATFGRLAHGLWYLHSEGELHGALHFANVLMSPLGPVMTDFGRLSEVHHRACRDRCCVLTAPSCVCARRAPPTRPTCTTRAPRWPPRSLRARCAFALSGTTFWCLRLTAAVR